ncbi:Mitochondrial substrate/solute carrier [Dillenia turbinata]|uniref:Mitochondrial substrate/solute carrier n=1 Tax=Dillenia turbinata TaxID=194707 RepID=A0AAN8V8A3_9MAGN
MQTEAATMGQRGLSTGHVIQQRSLHQQSSSHIGTVSHLLAGGVAGAVSKTCTAPLARLTILFQVQGMHSDVTTLAKTSIWREASCIVGEEGFRAFWKGNFVTIVHRLPYSSISFYSYERYKNLCQLVLGMEGHEGNRSAELFTRFTGGGLAGITAASATYPLDLVRTRLAAQRNVLYYRGISHALGTIVKEEGVMGLYRGLGATLMGVGPNLAINFTVYETLRSSWLSQRPEDSSVLVSLSCGSLAGIASSTGLVEELLSGELKLFARISQVRGVLFEHYLPDLFEEGCHVSALELTCPCAIFPLDLVRRRMQLEGAGGRKLIYKNGLIGALKDIVRSEGLKGLYRGILPEYYKVVPAVGIAFMTYEKLKALLSEPS